MTSRATICWLSIFQCALFFSCCVPKKAALDLTVWCALFIKRLCRAKCWHGHNIYPSLLLPAQPKIIRSRNQPCTMHTRHFIELCYLWQHMAIMLIHSYNLSLLVFVCQGWFWHCFIALHAFTMAVCIRNIPFILTCACKRRVARFIRSVLSGFLLKSSRGTFTYMQVWMWNIRKYQSEKAFFV